MREMAGETQSALGMLSGTPGCHLEKEEGSMKQAVERKQAGGNSTVH